MKLPITAKDNVAYLGRRRWRSCVNNLKSGTDSGKPEPKFTERVVPARGDRHDF
jgi:hypothetical protein